MRTSICAAHLWLCSLPWSEIPESQSLSFWPQIPVETDTETFSVQITGVMSSLINTDLIFYLTWQGHHVCVNIWCFKMRKTSEQMKHHTISQPLSLLLWVVFNQCNSHSYPSVSSYLDYPALSSIWPLLHQGGHVWSLRVIHKRAKGDNVISSDMC